MLLQWFRNISISKKLFFTTGVMALLIAVELFSLWFSVGALSSVRALVAAEGLYSKAQKDAVYYLAKYAHSHQEKDFELSQKFFKVNLGDGKARIALSKQAPDIEAAKQGLLEGRSHPADVDGMIMLLQNFNKVYYIQKAIEFWSKGDEAIHRILPLADTIHYEVNSPNTSQAKIDRLMREIDLINSRLTFVEDQFSYTLGEGSRWMENIILRILLIIALTVEISGLIITFSVSRGITRGINKISSAFKSVKEGGLSARVSNYYKDEIGILSSSFNQMADSLEQNINQRKKAENKLLKETSHLILLQNVASAANEALTFDEAILSSMAQIANLVGWPISHLLLVDRNNKTCTAIIQNMVRRFSPI